MAEGSGLRREVFEGRLWTLVVSIVLVVGLVATVIVLVITHHSSRHHEVKPVGVGKSGGCALAQQFSDKIPTAALSGTQWISLRGFDFPVSEAGPTSHSPDGAWTCEAHSPAGALESVIAFGAAAVAGNRAVAAGYLQPGSAAAGSIDQIVPEGGAAHESGEKIVGFEFQQFGGAGGTVNIVDSCTVPSCSSPYYSTSYNLLWAGRWEISNGGGNTTPVSSPAGAVVWEAP